MKKKYKEFLNKGKDIARNLKDLSKKEDIYKTIDNLNRLKENGSITDKDFEEIKKRLLKNVKEKP